MPLENRIKVCDKCQTTMSKCFEYNGRWLCKANACFDEEIEKDSGKHLKDEADLQEYRDLVARAGDIAPSSY